MPHITHINSYYISSALHDGLIGALDKQGFGQMAYVPVQDDSMPGSNDPQKLLLGRIVYDPCFDAVDRFLWPLKMIKIWKGFQKHIEPQKTSLIHAHSLMVNGWIALKAYKKWGLPYVVSVRSTDVHVFMKRCRLFRVLAAEILKSASAVIFLSPAYRDFQLKHFLPANDYRRVLQKSHVVSNGIHEYWLQNKHLKGIAGATPTIVFSGRIDRNKNLTALVKACDHLIDNHFPVRLNVVGDGPCLSAVQKGKHKTQIRFFGWIEDQEQLREIYRQSDILVVPSLRETFGLVYPEAMSQGLPVIYSRNEGFDGYFPDGQVGFAVSAKDPADIARKIKTAFEAYGFLSSNAIVAADQFSWDQVVKQLSKIYTDVLAIPHNPVTL